MSEGRLRLAIEIEDPEVVDVSFPGFWTLLRDLAAGTPSREIR